MWRPVLGTVFICAGLGALAAGGLVRDGNLWLTPMALAAAGVLIGGVVGAERAAAPVGAAG